MTRSLGKSGILKFGIGLIALTVAASVQAKTLVYCSEGSPEGFNPQLFTSGTTYDASSVPIYNSLADHHSKNLLFKAGFFRLQFMRMSTSFATTGFALWRASICRPREIYLSFTLN